MTDFRALCAELLNELATYDQCDSEEKVVDHWNYTDCSELIFCAYSALAQPEPQGAELIYRYSPVTIAECGGPCKQGPQYCDCGQIKGEPKPQGPTDATSRVTHYLEQRRLIRGLEPEVIHALHLGTDETRQATLTASDLEALARWGRSTIEPVPVAERLPGPEDCDAEGQVWGWYRDGRLGFWQMRVINKSPKSAWLPTHWLHHHALPVPQQEVDRD